KFAEIPSGCCGMAGSFGYEKEHYELSEKIGREILFPAIEKLDDSAEVVACGFSCRHQIEHFTGRKAKHFVEILKGDGAVKYPLKPEYFIFSNRIRVLTKALHRRVHFRNS